MPDLMDTISDIANSPKRVKGDRTEVEMPNIKDVILADEYKKLNEDGASSRRKERGLRITQLVPPGAGQ